VLSDGQLSIFMAYSVGNLSDEDVSALISFLRTVPPVPHEHPVAAYTVLGKLLLPVIGLHPRTPVRTPAVPASDAPSVERGQYLANEVAKCITCHSPMDMATFETIKPRGGGFAMAQPSPQGDGSSFVTPNLTSHPTGVTGRLDEDAFVARIRAGRTYTWSIMPWEQVARMTDADLRSVYRYLRSLPPVDQDVGPTFRPAG
jgi:mono/diheme cytochrome c family protein